MKLHIMSIDTENLEKIFGNLLENHLATLTFLMFWLFKNQNKFHFLSFVKLQTDKNTSTENLFADEDK